MVQSDHFYNEKQGGHSAQQWIWINKARHSKSSSMAQHDSALPWLNRALLGVCGGGIIPNVLSAVVLIKERNTIPGAWTLLGLAVADGGLLFVQGCYAVLCLSEVIRYHYFLLPLLLSQRWLWMAGIYLVIALAMGRYIAVTKPHLARIWNSKGRQRKIVALVFTVTLLVAALSFF